MAVKQKFITDKRYDVEDYFIDSLHELDLYVAMHIAKFVEKNLEEFPVNNLHSYILGGCIVNIIGDPITFALEIVREDGGCTTLTDVSLITMDEFLDLVSLNCYIKNPK
tara:strand:+ start:19806 stop:20132 length:327 start_codon:yes stop_codon:yes gene_type:complete